MKVISTSSSNHKKKIGIYGAGSAGRQLANALQHSGQFRIICFFDDSKDIAGQYINNIKVYPAKSAQEVVKKNKIDEIFIAIPSLSRRRKKQIVETLQNNKVIVKILPGLDELIDGKIKVNDLREIHVEDLLGRDPVKPIKQLLSKDIKDKVVMITGAGGSIGSELSRQISKLGAKKIILFELNESSLYSINEELKNENTFPILGSVLDEKRVHTTCKKFSVDTIYHAAAYKHVPMVEFNILEGLRNNIFGTLNCAKVAINNNVKSFILISTDKAVRPTNIMGVSKRIAEITIMSLSNKKPNTIFSVVRFGNVLNSSGSVIPLFKKQIFEGGPVTVTHKDIERFFMTIPEAVELVIQAGALAKGGEVFLLDMGEPVKIYDLAKKMIKLSGLSVRNINNPNGDIEISFTGLRPGEKLFEELLINNNSLETMNPMIMQETNVTYDYDKFHKELKFLERSLNDDSSVKDLIKLLKSIVPDFSHNSGAMDLVNT